MAYFPQMLCIDFLYVWKTIDNIKKKCEVQNFDVT